MQDVPLHHFESRLVGGAGHPVTTDVGISSVFSRRVPRAIEYSRTHRHSVTVFFQPSNITLSHHHTTLFFVRPLYVFQQSSHLCLQVGAGYALYYSAFSVLLGRLRFRIWILTLNSINYLFGRKEG